MRPPRHEAHRSFQVRAGGGVGGSPGARCPSPLEQADGLEQLRPLHYGHNIHVTTVTAGRDDGYGVDTPDDLQHVRHLFTKRSGTSDEQQ